MSLTDRERQVMALVIEGATNKEISARLFICDGTIKSHLVNIKEKLGAKNRTHAAVIYVRSSHEADR